MDSGKFFDVHVRPSVDDWRNDPDDLRKAMQAAVAVNQMADHFWLTHSSNPSKVLGKGTLKEFRGELAKKSKGFALIRDIADAFKHAKINRSDRLLTSAGQTTVMQLGFGEAEYGVAQYGGVPEVVVTLDDGRKESFRSALEEACRLWESLQ